MKIAVLSSHTPSLFWFRMDMMREFIRRGHEVVAVGNEDADKWSHQFDENGVRYIQAKISRNGTNPVRDLQTFFSLKRILKTENPDKIFTYQAKTVIYGGLAAKSLDIAEVYPLIAGVGSVFLNDGVKAKMIRSILLAEYHMAVSNLPGIFFQNADDVSLFRHYKILKDEAVTMLSGSGVNLKHFTEKPLPDSTAFLFVGRLIRDKGIYEYLEACRMVKKSCPNVRCLLVGPFDSNPTALREEELRPYIDDGIIEYFGEQSDVRPYLAQCSVFVLPSYREGTPKAALEAMATGRAVITTDAPGCRETVTDGINGYLVPVKDPDAVAEKMISLANSPDTVAEMAKAGRRMAEERFDVNLVNAIICNTMKIEETIENGENEYVAVSGTTS